MSFRIERLVSGENAIVFRVTGRMHLECVNTLKGAIEEESTKLALDLSGVTQADRDTAAFLARLRAQGYRTKELFCFSSWLDLQRAGSFCAVAVPAWCW